MKHQITTVFTFFAFMAMQVMLISIAQAGTLTSTVNQNQISLNETLVLTVNYTEQVDSSQLDLSSLKNDFDVLSSSPQSSNRVSIINGQTTREASTSWSIILTPKRAGRLLIPAFSINGDDSKAITIQAAKAKQEIQGSSSNQAMTAKVTVNRNTVHVGQQLVVNIELSTIKSVSDVRGEQPIVDGLSLELYDQKNSQEIVNGIARQTTSWVYIAFPKESGEITIPALNFTGLVNARRDFFNNIRDRGKQVFARTSPVSVSINKPIPTTGNRLWFPAENVDIRAEWSGDKTQLRVGEPITRSIVITAEGQPSSAIPPLKLETNSKDYKSYGDQPKLQDTLAASGLIGLRTEAQAIIPSKAGTLTLTEQKIPWWNINTKQWEEATLAAETLTIAPAINSVDSNTTTSAAASVENTALKTALNQTSQVNNAALSQTQVKAQTNNSSHWFWKLATAILSVICLAQAWFTFKLTRKQVGNPSANRNNTHTNKNPNENQAWKQLLNALPSNDALNIRNHIIEWSRHALPEQKHYTLHNLAMYSGNPELSEQLKRLDEHLYKGTPLKINKLREALNETREGFLSEIKYANTPQSELAPLYPV